MMKKIVFLSCLVSLFNLSHAQIQLQRDLSFGNNGIFVYNQASSFGVELHIQDDNSLLLTNMVTDMIPNRYILKINTNGTLDNNFGQNGYLQLDNSSNTFHKLFNSTGGKFYVNYPDPYTSAINNRIVSYNPNGTINTNFSNNGVMQYDFSITQGNFVPTGDGGLLLIKNDGFTKYLQTGSKDLSFGINGELASNNSSYPIEAIAADGNKLFFDNFAGTKRIDVTLPNIIEKEESSIYLNPGGLSEVYKTKVKNDYGLYYFRFVRNQFNPSIFTNIRLKKTNGNLLPATFGINQYIDLPINPDVSGNNTDMIYTPSGRYLIFGRLLMSDVFLSYDENGNQINVNGQQFYTDPNIPTPLSYVNLYSKGNVIYLVGERNQEVVIVKYNITDSQVLSATENFTHENLVIHNPFKNLISIQDSSNQIKQMNLYDYNGRLILSTDKTEIDTSHVLEGNYVLKITTKSGQVIDKKLIKAN